MSYFCKLVIVCPSSIFSSWGTSPIADLFVGGNIELRIAGDAYTRIEEGSDSSFNDFFSGVGYNQSPKRIGFNVAIQDKRDELALALKELSLLSLGTTYTAYTPVTIYDYVRVENRADYSNGFTTRVGKIWVENLTGTIQKGNLICSNPAIEVPNVGRYNNGFNLRFLASKKQLVN